MKILTSLKATDGEYSARKLSAFTVIVCVVVTHIFWLKSIDYTQLTNVLTIDYMFISVCLGMTTYEKIKTKQNEK